MPRHRGADHDDGEGQRQHPDVHAPPNQVAHVAQGEAPEAEDPGRHHAEVGRRRRRDQRHRRRPTVRGTPSGPPAPSAHRGRHRQHDEAGDHHDGHPRKTVDRWHRCQQRKPGAHHVDRPQERGRQVPFGRRGRDVHPRNGGQQRPRGVAGDAGAHHTTGAARHEPAGGHVGHHERHDHHRQQEPAARHEQRPADDVDPAVRGVQVPEPPGQQHECHCGAHRVVPRPQGGGEELTGGEGGCQQQRREAPAALGGDGLQLVRASEERGEACAGVDDHLVTRQHDDAQRVGHQVQHRGEEQVGHDPVAVDEGHGKRRGAQQITAQEPGPCLVGIGPHMAAGHERHPAGEHSGDDRRCRPGQRPHPYGDAGERQAGTLTGRRPVGDDAQAVTTSAAWAAWSTTFLPGTDPGRSESTRRAAGTRTVSNRVALDDDRPDRHRRR